MIFHRKKKQPAKISNSKSQFSSQLIQINKLKWTTESNNKEFGFFASTKNDRE